MNQSETGKQVDPIASARAKSAVRLNGSGANNLSGTRVSGMFATRAGTNRRITAGDSHGKHAGREDAGDLGGTAVQQA